MSSSSSSGGPAPSSSLQRHHAHTDTPDVDEERSRTNSAEDHHGELLPTLDEDGHPSSWVLRAQSMPGDVVDEDHPSSEMLSYGQDERRLRGSSIDHPGRDRRSLPEDRRANRMMEGDDDCMERDRVLDARGRGTMALDHSRHHRESHHGTMMPEGYSVSPPPGERDRVLVEKRRRRVLQPHFTMYMPKPRHEPYTVVVYHSSMEGMAKRLKKLYLEKIRLVKISFDYFADGWPQLQFSADDVHKMQDEKASVG